jgi:hypothetical protein
MGDGSELTAASLGAAGLDPDQAHQVTCNLDLQTMVEAKMGVAILPASLFKRGALQHISCPGLDARRTVSVYSIAGRARSREAAALLNLARMTDWDATLTA